MKSEHIGGQSHGNKCIFTKHLSINGRIRQYFKSAWLRRTEENYQRVAPVPKELNFEFYVSFGAIRPSPHCLDVQIDINFKWKINSNLRYRFLFNSAINAYMHLMPSTVYTHNYNSNECDKSDVKRNVKQSLCLAHSHLFYSFAVSISFR